MAEDKQIEEMRRILSSIPEDDKLLKHVANAAEYLLVVVERQQREIEALRGQMSKPKKNPNTGVYHRPTRPGVVIK